MYALWTLWNHRTRIVAATMVTVMACGSPGVAIPTSVTARAAWGELRPTYDGSVRAWGRGHLENRGGSVMVLNGSYRDMRADGNGAYVKVTFQERRPNSSGGGSSWHQVTTQSTPEIGTSSGYDPIRQSNGVELHYNHANWLNSYSSRAYTRVCAQFGWPVSDPCAVAVPTLSI